jgi:protein-tyrosine phosphatase
MGASVGERLRIDPVEVPRVHGSLGLCACPVGRRAPVGAVEDLARDLGSILAFGAVGVVSLVEERELMLLGIETLPLALRRERLWWKHLPITDMGVPDEDFERRWGTEGPAIHEALERGGHVVLHCWAGLGRTGTVAARLLVEAGLDPDAAILRVRHARPGTIQTRRQERYVLGLAPRGR